MAKHNNEKRRQRILPSPLSLVKQTKQYFADENPHSSKKILIASVLLQTINFLLQTIVLIKLFL